MDNDRVRLHFQVLQQQVLALQEEKGEAWKEINRLLEELHVIYEEMQTNLEAAQVVEEELLLSHQRIMGDYYHYHDLFQSSPIAYLVTDAKGIIIEANQASSALLNVPHCYLVGKPLVVYIQEGERSTLYTKLNELSLASGLQTWQINLCPRNGNPFIAEFKVAIGRDHLGAVETLRMGVYEIGHHQALVTPSDRPLQEEGPQIAIETAAPTLPQSLDGLQVLVVDDEADARDFIVAVLESYGICVTAVASATQALESLEKFRPDVLVCDIRMPGSDGYSLIRQIRALEAKQGRHIPAGALSAYLDENMDKALDAGFEAHLHKLAQPSELVKMVAQLAKQTLAQKSDS